ncbi:hypothetical protein [Kitasatospora sp. NPDC002965]|uniref:hypothetical protein n=1 Tax=Kitasatospora sp. NPDC002965 TaxID=3154775 RepID=UPI0033AB0A09
MTDRTTDSTSFLDVMGALERQTALAAEAWDTAQEEIDAARERHGETEQGPLWNAFLLLQPSDVLESAPRLYRAHVRELLERVATRQDTRPATGAELLAAVSAGSVQVPLPPSALCLAARLTAQLPPGDTLPVDAEVLDVEGYERLFGAEADEHARRLGAMLHQDWRTQG